MADKYILRVTAGSSYDLSTHTEVAVNTATPLKISNQFMDIELSVRIQNYHGLPRNSPSTSRYFASEPHDYNKDLYSIAFRFMLKQVSQSTTPTSKEVCNKHVEKEEGKSPGDYDAEEENFGPEGISGGDLQFGNDFDHPIRDRLPPGFGTAMNIVRWWIDPGLEGDVYADCPYLYGPALSSFNAIHVGSGMFDEERGGLWVEEGGDDAGRISRSNVGAPDGSKERMKWALHAGNKERWVWKYGQTYAIDFFNPYLDFSEFALRLPGFNLPIMKYWDGQGLRYVLRNRSTTDVYLVVLFTLYLKEDINEDGSLKPTAIQATLKQPTEDPESQLPADKHSNFDVNEQKMLEEARRHLGVPETGGQMNGEEIETSVDDVD